MRVAPRAALPELRHAERSERQVLWRMRHRSPRERVRRTAVPSPSAPVAERRLVSVLFADLVGFTTLSEARDAEAVRELLTGTSAARQRSSARTAGRSRSSSATR